MRNTLHIIVQAILALIIWSQPAWAGPAAGAVLASAFKSFLINMIVSAITNKIFGKKDAGRGAERSVLVNKQSNNDFIPIVYGKHRVGGTRAFIETSNGSGSSGTSNLNMVIAMCEGEMGDIKQLYFNDTVVWDADASGTTTGSDTAGYTLANFESTGFQSYINAQYFPGHADQTVSTLIQDSVGSSTWTNNHRLRGIAYIALKLPFNAGAYESGVPTVTAVLDGKRVEDVSNLGNYINSGDQNPADVLYDYLRTKKDLAASDINIASFQSAKTYCATRYKINGVLDTENSLIDNVESILQACNGMLVFHNGEYKLKIKQSGETASKTFTADNIVTDATVSLTDIKGRLSKITIDFNNESADVKYNADVVIRENATYKTQDAGRTLEQQISIPMITDKTLIETMGDFLLDDSRNRMMIEFEAAHTEFGLEAGDIMAVTLDEFGFTNKLFRVMQTELTPDNTISVVGQEYNSSIHI